MRSPFFPALISQSRRLITRFFFGREMGSRAFHKLWSGEIGAQELHAFLDQGLSPNWSSSFGESLLSACYRQDLDWAARMLIDWGARVSRSAPTGFDELTQASFLGATRCMALLIERGSDPISTRDRLGFDDYGSPMALAASHGQIASLRFLIDRGANPSISDSEGSTPLMMAAMAGHSDSVAFLLSRGADASARDRKGYLALELALLNGQLRAAQILASASGFEWRPGPNPTSLSSRVRESFAEEAAALSLPESIEDWHGCVSLARALEERLELHAPLVFSAGHARAPSRARL